MEGIIPWQREFIGREDWRNWMVSSLETATTKSIIHHIHGIGGIGKSSLLRFWDQTIDQSVLIDCILQPDIDSQMSYLVRSLKNNGISFSRYELLWSIKKRVVDGI